MRLNKYLAENWGVSRREADEMILAGRVRVDGVIARLGARAEGEILVDGKAVLIKDKVYLAMNKPVGYVSSRRRQGGATIYELLPEKYLGLKTVGRLDKNSSGLILLTNDGDFAYQMTHPKFQKIKRYEVILDKPLEPLHRQEIADFGVDLADGKSRLGLVEMGNRKKWMVEMREGRNRQVRRTFGALGYEVVGLHRVQFGKYELGAGLRSGEVEQILP
jgi:23S rRNA pseudouridine2605 synthase